MLLRSWAYDPDQFPQNPYLGPIRTVEDQRLIRIIGGMQFKAPIVSAKNLESSFSLHPFHKDCHDFAVFRVILRADDCEVSIADLRV